MTDCYELSIELKLTGDTRMLQAISAIGQLQKNIALSPLPIYQYDRQSLGFSKKSLQIILFSPLKQIKKNVQLFFNNLTLLLLWKRHLRIFCLHF